MNISTKKDLAAGSSSPASDLGKCIVARRRTSAMILLAAMLPGCVQRQMTVTSNPPGAVVYLNDREMGRTPFTKNFLWYGNYDVVVRKDGYDTLKTTREITAPFWQFFPLDVVTDFLPIKDSEKMEFNLRPQGPVDPQAIVARGLELQEQLESSEHTVHHAVLGVKRPTAAPTPPVEAHEPVPTGNALPSGTR